MEIIVVDKHINKYNEERSLLTIKAAFEFINILVKRMFVNDELYKDVQEEFEYILGNHSWTFEYMFRNAFVARDLYPHTLKLYMPSFYNLTSNYIKSYGDLYKKLEKVYSDNIVFITNKLDEAIEDYYNKDVIWSIDIFINLCVIKYIQYLYSHSVILNYFNAEDWVKSDCIRIINKFNSDPNNIYNSLLLEVSLLDDKDLDNTINTDYYNNELYNFNKSIIEFNKRQNLELDRIVSKYLISQMYKGETFI